MDLSGEPHSVSFPLERPVLIAGKSYDRMGAKHFCYDPGMAPKGKSAVVVYLESDYDFWKTLSADRKSYKAEKNAAAAKVVDALDSRFPGLKEAVEVVDVATPVTTERYTGNWRGSYEGWLITTATSKYMVRPLKRELPGLDSFYMIGQWLAPGGGLPPAALHGREVVKTICRRAHQDFTVSRPLNNA
jgi:phytoene dehydrogenase-like protein